MSDPTEHFQRQWEDMDPATAEINRLRDEITALRARLDAVERERDEAKESARWAYIDGCLDGDDDIVLARAEHAEAALATARREAYERAAQVAETAKAVCARCNSPEDNHPYRHPFVPVVMINIPAAIRALAALSPTGGKD